MIRTSFEHELEKLRTDLVKMGAMVEQAIENAVTAFEENNQMLAKEIVKGDRDINDFEKSIEARALSLMLRQQPVAGDLRNISSALKVVTDMERIGDQSADIGEIILRVGEVPHVVLAENVCKMAKKAKKMVGDAVSAFVMGDDAAAEKTIAADDEVDALFNLIKDEVIALLKSNSGDSDKWVDLLMIAKYIERIGDHAVNICEWAQFAKTGKLNNVRLL